MRNIRVAAIVVDYKDSPHTLDCLDSLKKQKLTNIEVQVFLVLSQSSPERRKQLKREYPETEFIISDKNIGFTGSNNLALKKILEKNAFEYVLLLNNDTRIDKDAIKNFVKFAEGYGSPVVCSPKIYFEKNYEYHSNEYLPEEKGNVIWYAGGMFDKKNVYAWHRGVDEVDHGQFNNDEETQFATGCCMFVSTKIVKKIKLFDNRYFLYLEDLDFSLRAKKEGFHIWYVPEAVVWHKNAGSTGGSGSLTHVYYQTRNRLLLASKFSGIRTKAALYREMLQNMLKGKAMQKFAFFDFLLHKFGECRRTL